METQRGYEPPNPDKPYRNADLGADLKKLKILGLERKLDALHVQFSALDVNDPANAPKVEQLKKDFDKTVAELDALRVQATRGELRRSLDKVRMEKKGVGEQERLAS